MEEVAYRPLGNTKAPEFKDNVAQIPPYEDIGVEYKGYSKKLIGPNQYELKPQAPVFSFWKPGTIAPSTVVSNSFGQPIKGKKLYIKSMQLNSSVSGISANSYFRMSDGAGKVFFEHAPLRSDAINIIFNTPLVIENEYDPNITPSGAQMVFASGSITINQCSINVQGWIE